MRSMKLTRHQRRSTVLLLQLCTLLGLLTCSVHQGQRYAQQLLSAEQESHGLASGLHQPAHNMHGDGHDSPDSGQDGDSHHPGPMDMPSVCPLCSSMGHGTALTSLHGAGDYPSAIRPLPVFTQHRHLPQPRLIRPALNPRAPPTAIDAAAIV